MISLVIPIYILDEKLEELTENCLMSLKGEYDELIIVDDGSPRKQKELKKIADRYIKHKENKGFTRTVNDGISVATGDYICVINNDTELMSGSLLDLQRPGFSFPRIKGKETPFWDGAFYMFPRDVGYALYDERYKNYFGDLDKFIVAKVMGIPLERVDSVVVKHHEEQTSKKAGIRNVAFEEDKIAFEEKFGVPFLHAYTYLEL